MPSGATGSSGPDASTAVVVRPARDLAEASRAGELLRAGHDQNASPAYLEHLRDVGPRMTRAELLVAVDAEQRVLGSVTYARAGTPFALASLEGEAELRMLGVADHRSRTGELLIEACIERAERDEAVALVMSSVRNRGHNPGKPFLRLGFRWDRTRELAPMPGLTLDVFTLALPRGTAVGPAPRPRWRR